jgi:hypothetical protein
MALTPEQAHFWRGYHTIGGSGGSAAGSAAAAGEGRDVFHTSLVMRAIFRTRRVSLIHPHHGV